MAYSQLYQYHEIQGNKPFTPQIPVHPRPWAIGLQRIAVVDPIPNAQWGWHTVDASEIQKKTRQLSLVVEIPLFTGLGIHPRWLFGISSINSHLLTKLGIFVGFSCRYSKYTIDWVSGNVSEKKLHPSKLTFWRVMENDFSFQQGDFHVLHSLKLTVRPWNRPLESRRFLLGSTIFTGENVRFREGIYNLLSIFWRLFGWPWNQSILSHLPLDCSPSLDREVLCKCWLLPQEMYLEYDLKYALIRTEENCCK